MIDLLLRIVRRVVLVLMIAALASPSLLACDESDEATVNTGEPPSRKPPSPDPEPQLRGSDPDTIDVALDVRTDLGEPIVGRSVTLLDARGRSKERLTDEGGLVHFMRVVPPYDVVVAEAASGVMLVPTAVLGLSRRDPVLELFERDGSTTKAPAQTIRLAVAPPPCSAPSCFISVASGSPSGGGTTSASYTGATAPVVLSIDHEWTGSLLAKNELIDVHVLTGDVGRSTFAYATHLGISAAPGEGRDIGTLAPLPIQATSDVAIATHLDEDALGRAYERTLMTWLDLPGGGTMALAFVEGAGTRLRFPLLPAPGGRVRVDAWAQHPPVEGTVPFHHSAHSRSGDLTIGDGPIDVKLMLGPKILRPTLDGRLSRRGLGFEWSNVPGTFLHQLTVSDLGRAKMRFRVLTSETSLSIARLATLGLEKLAPGPHLLDLATTAALVPNDITSPDERQRRRGSDPARAARISYQRLGFTVTP